MVIVILVAASVMRFFAVPPFVIMILVFLGVRKVKRKMEQEARKQQEQSQEETYWEEQTQQGHYQHGQTREEQSHQGPHHTNDGNGAGYAGYTGYAGSTGRINTIITCEYCGSKVDTERHAVCNHCGGAYWDNEEWKNIQRKRGAE